MITHLSVSGIKLFDKQIKVDFASTTFISGNNSSGKSTLIQCLLLLAQSLRPGAAIGALELNGPLCRLGGSDNVIRSTGAHAIIQVCFKSVGTSFRISLVVKAEGDEVLIHRIEFREHTDNLKIFGKRIVDVPSGLIMASARGTHSSGYFQFGSKIAVLDGVSIIEVLRKNEGLTLRQETALSMHLAEEVRQLLEDNLREFQLMGDNDRRIATQLRSSNRNMFADEWLNLYRRLGSVRPEHNGTDIDMMSDLESMVKTRVDRFSRIGQILAWMKSEARTTLDSMVELVDLLDIIELLARLDQDIQELPHEEYSKVEIPTDWAKLDFITHEYLSSINYIGPLRQSVQLLYQHDSAKTPWDIGSRGERTGAVLSRYGTHKVPFQDPAYLSDSCRSEVSSTTLTDAVNRSLEFIGLAKAVDVVPVQPYGLSIRINQVDSGGQIIAVEISQVGTGVSQALPIVVAACGMSIGSTLIVEQPELHLNPATQTRLANFLIAQTSIGKQIIIETHSEHILNAIRLSIAKGSVPPDQVGISYLEHGGYGVFVTNVKIDKNGALSSYPTGFFDESENVGFMLLQSMTAERNGTSDTN